MTNSLPERIDFSGIDKPIGLLIFTKSLFLEGPNYFGGINFDPSNLWLLERLTDRTYSSTGKRGTFLNAINVNLEELSLYGAPE